MPLVGEQSWSGWAYNTGDDYYSASWDLDFPPSAAFIKVFLADHYEFDDKSAVHVGLLNIRRRLPNGQDQTISFPDLDYLNSVKVQYNPTMTHVTFGMKLKSASCDLVWTLGYWA